MQYLVSDCSPWPNKMVVKGTVFNENWLPEPELPNGDTSKSNQQKHSNVHGLFLTDKRSVLAILEKRKWVKFASKVSVWM